MHRLRATFAILIVFSLTLAPVTAAWAAAQMSAVVVAAGPAASTSTDAMSDCMKAMQSNDQGPVQEQHCPCRDVPSSTLCSDVGACLAKCSVHMTPVLWHAAESCRLPIRRNYRPADRQEPPDWAYAPPAPPPRA